MSLREHDVENCVLQAVGELAPKLEKCGKSFGTETCKQCSDLRAVSCTGCIDRILQTEMGLLFAMPSAGLTASQKRCLIARALSLSFFMISSCMCAQHACFLSDSALALGSLG